MLCTEAALESGSYSKYFSVCLFFFCVSAVSNVRLELEIVMNLLTPLFHFDMEHPVLSLEL